MIKLYNDDCIKILKNIKNESIDLIVTDPPYRICSGGCSTGAYGNGKKSNPDARQGKLFKYNDIKFSEWLPELYRVLKPNSHIYIYIYHQETFVN